MANYSSNASLGILSAIREDTDLEVVSPADPRGDADDSDLEEGPPPPKKRAGEKRVQCEPISDPDEPPESPVETAEPAGEITDAIDDNDAANEERPTEKSISAELEAEEDE